jgi:hypothetical protein
MGRGQPIRRNGSGFFKTDSPSRHPMTLHGGSDAAYSDLFEERSLRA